MTYNVFSGTLNPTHFTSPPLNCIIFLWKFNSHSTVRDFYFSSCVSVVTDCCSSPGRALSAVCLYALDSVVDFSTICIVCLFTSYTFPLILLSSLFSLLIYSLIVSFLLWIDPLFPCCRSKEATKPVCFNCFILFYFICYSVFVFLMRDYLCLVSPRFIVYFCSYFSRVFFLFFSTSQVIDWYERLQNDLFCVKWVVKP